MSRYKGKGEKGWEAKGETNVTRGNYRYKLIRKNETNANSSRYRADNLKIIYFKR